MGLEEWESSRVGAGDFVMDFAGCCGCAMSDECVLRLPAWGVGCSLTSERSVGVVLEGLTLA